MCALTTSHSIDSNNDQPFSSSSTVRESIPHDKSTPLEKPIAVQQEAISASDEDEWISVPASVIPVISHSEPTQPSLSKPINKRNWDDGDDWDDDDLPLPAPPPVTKTREAKPTTRRQSMLTKTSSKGHISHTSVHSTSQKPTETISSPLEREDSSMSALLRAVEDGDDDDIDFDWDELWKEEDDDEDNNNIKDDDDDDDEGSSRKKSTPPALPKAPKPALEVDTSLWSDDELSPLPSFPSISSYPNAQARPLSNPRSGDGNTGKAYGDWADDDDDDGDDGDDDHNHNHNQTRNDSNNEFISAISIQPPGVSQRKLTSRQQAVQSQKQSQSIHRASNNPASKSNSVKANKNNRSVDSHHKETTSTSLRGRSQKTGKKIVKDEWSDEWSEHEEENLEKKVTLSKATTRRESIHQQRAMNQMHSGISRKGLESGKKAVMVSKEIRDDWDDEEDDDWNREKPQPSLSQSQSKLKPVITSNTFGDDWDKEDEDDLPMEKPVNTTSVKPTKPTKPTPRSRIPQSAFSSTWSEEEEEEDEEDDWNREKPQPSLSQSKSKSSATATYPSTQSSSSPSAESISADMADLLADFDISQLSQPFSVLPAVDEKEQVCY